MTSGKARLRRSTAIASVIIGLLALVAVSAAAAVVASSGGSSDQPGPSPDAVISKLPDRLPYTLPDGTRGFIDKRATAPDPGEDLHSYLAEWSSKLAPITRAEDPKSPVVGYYLINYGFVDLATATAPGFDVQTLVAQGSQRQADLGRQLSQAETAETSTTTRP